MGAITLVKNFHKDIFPGWKPSRSYEEVVQDPFHNELPFVELEFDWDTKEIYKELSSKKYEDFWIKTDNSTKFFNPEWYHFAYHEGWMEIRISGNSPEYRRILPENHTLDVEAEIKKGKPHLYKPDALPITQKFLKSKGFVFTRLMALKCKPGAFVYPHIDDGKRDTEEKNLECFWIPINDCQDNLKIYPYGYVPHKIGNMYLLNSKSFWHSVYNFDNHDRYVLIGRIDSEASNFPIDYLKKSIKQQWYS